MALLEGIAVIGAGLLFLYMLWRLVRGPGAYVPFGSKLPPIQGGLPWIGCIKEFGKEPLWYIGKSIDKHGDIFTIMVAGKWLTFVLDPDYYQHFFSSDSVSFQAAACPVVNKVSGLPSDEFMKYHMTCHEKLKGHFASSTAVLCPAMCSEFHSSLFSYGETGQKLMYDFVQEAMFEAITKELFGRDNMPKNKADMLHMMEIFRRYDEQFEYGADLPEFLFRKWSESKYGLLKLFKEGLPCEHEFEKRENGLVAEVVSAIVEYKQIPHYQLVTFWAAHGNATPVVYWVLCHILSDPELYKAVMKEVEQINLYNEDGELVPIEEAELKKCSFVKRCVMESVRLHAPGAIARKVVKTHTIKVIGHYLLWLAKKPHHVDYTIPAGHMIMLSPYWGHRNPKYFPEPHQFKPDRWLQCDLEHNQFLKGFIPFGGGRYQCSGKVFAIMEMQLFVVMVLKMFDIEIKDSFPLESPVHMLGTTHPAVDCRVHFRRKPRA